MARIKGFDRKAIRKARMKPLPVSIMMHKDTYAEDIMQGTDKEFKERIKKLDEII